MTNNNILSFNAVIFDMDGVLLDTESLYRDAWIKIGDRHGYADMAVMSKKCIGVNTQKEKEILFDHYGADFPFEQLEMEVRKEVDQTWHGRFPLKIGVIELLSYLKAKQIPMAVASSTASRYVTPQLKAVGIYDYFTCFACGNEITHSKPHPEIYLLACKKLGLKPEECIAIEDSYNGIRSAYSGGLIPIMVPDLLPPTEEIAGLAGQICSSLLDVKNMLESNALQRN